MIYLTLFAVSFVQVFALGFQSRNVNCGRYGWAAGTSFFIGLSQAVVWRRITADSAGLAEAVVYGIGGAFGIVVSMAVHSRFIGSRS